jgi:hypothetical protein
MMPSTAFAVAFGSGARSREDARIWPEARFDVMVTVVSVATAAMPIDCVPLRNDSDPESPGADAKIERRPAFKSKVACGGSRL